MSFNQYSSSQSPQKASMIMLLACSHAFNTFRRSSSVISVESFAQTLWTVYLRYVDKTFITIDELFWNNRKPPIK